MPDPFAEVVWLLQPSAPFAKRISDAGPWSVRRAEAGTSCYCVVLDGERRLAVDGRESVILVTPMSGQGQVGIFRSSATGSPATSLASRTSTVLVTPAGKECVMQRMRVRRIISIGVALLLLSLLEQTCRMFK